MSDFVVLRNFKDLRGILFRTFLESLVLRFGATSGGDFAGGREALQAHFRVSPVSRCRGRVRRGHRGMDFNADMPTLDSRETMELMLASIRNIRKQCFDLCAGRESVNERSDLSFMGVGGGAGWGLFEALRDSL
jgi:hypothetical protein